jgi:hypothetical protein
MQVFELRQYTINPGQRDAMVALFDREFVETQEAVGSAIIGQFRNLDDPNRFVWIRGHADMAQRKKSMHAFYDGPDWFAHREAANATIADSDNVLLLKPAWPGSGFSYDGARAPQGTTTLPGGIVTAHICNLSGPPNAMGIVKAFRPLVPAIEHDGTKVLAALVTETAENNFPRHPIREGETVFVWFSLFADEASEARHMWQLPPELARLAIKPIEKLRLQPTPRSKLHG